MRALVIRAVTGAATATGLLALLVSIAPHHGRRLVAGWLLVLAFLATRVLLPALLAARGHGRSAFDQALRSPSRQLTAPAELERLRRTLHLGSSSALHAQSRLRPRLAAIAADRLAWRRGIDLAAEPEAAGQALGEPAWGLVRPDAPVVDDRTAPGPSLATIEAAVRALEAL